MKNIIKDACILFAITLVAGILLGLVYNVTKDPIAQQNEKAKQKAYQEVIADADKFEALDGSYASDKVAETAKTVLSASATDFSKDEVSEVVAGIKNGKIIGFVVTVVAHDGYGGDIQFAMGIQDDGTLNGISILSIGETAGLGMRANTDAFKDQFKDKNVDKFEYTKTGATADDQIDALSGATITTNAMTNGVNAGLCAFQYEKGGNQ